MPRFMAAFWVESRVRRLELKKSIKTDGTPEDVEKDAEAEVQKVHDKYIKKVDELYAAKEKEIMTV